MIYFGGGRWGCEEGILLLTEAKQKGTMRRSVLQVLYNYTCRFVGIYKYISTTIYMTITYETLENYILL